MLESSMHPSGMPMPRGCAPDRTRRAGELFEPVADRELFAVHDNVVKAFADLYRESGAAFPAECSETEYRRRLEAAYPREVNPVHLRVRFSVVEQNANCVDPASSDCSEMEHVWR
jgi:hypothetical protein